MEGTKKYIRKKGGEKWKLSSLKLTEELDEQLNDLSRDMLVPKAIIIRAILKTNIKNFKEGVQA